MAKGSLILMWMYSISLLNKLSLGSIFLNWEDIEDRMIILIVWYYISRYCQWHSEVYRQHMIVVIYRCDGISFEVSRSREWKMKWSESSETYSLQMWRHHSKSCHKIHLSSSILCDTQWMPAFRGAFARWRCVKSPSNENRVHSKALLSNDLDIVQFNKQNSKI